MTRQLDTYAHRALVGYRTAAVALDAGGNLGSLTCDVHDAAIAAANDFGLYWPPNLAAIEQWLDDHDVDLDDPAGTDADARRNAADFWSYFNVADELDGGLTLDDLDGTYVDEARHAADVYRLAWPPALADAEEFALRHRTALDAAMRG